MGYSVNLTPVFVYSLWCGSMGVSLRSAAVGREQQRRSKSWGRPPLSSPSGKDDDSPFDSPPSTGDLASIIRYIAVRNTLALVFFFCSNIISVLGVSSPRLMWLVSCVGQRGGHHGRVLSRCSHTERGEVHGFQLPFVVQNKASRCYVTATLHSTGKT